MKKEKKGITLIALVLTIIVLLILAAVAISLALGQNGLLSKSRSAQEEQIKAEIKDLVSSEEAAARAKFELENPRPANEKGYIEEEIEKAMDKKGYDVDGFSSGTPTINGKMKFTKKNTNAFVEYELTEDPTNHIVSVKAK